MTLINKITMIMYYFMISDVNHITRYLGLCNQAIWLDRDLSAEAVLKCCARLSLGEVGESRGAWAGVQEYGYTVK